MLSAPRSRSVRLVQSRLVTAPARLRLINLLWVIVLSALPVILHPGLEAQGLDQAHITPRAQPTPPPPPPPVNNILDPNLKVDPTLKTHTKPLKVDVNLVLVNVTITDPMNRIVTG